MIVYLLIGPGERAPIIDVTRDDVRATQWSLSGGPVREIDITALESLLDVAEKLAADVEALLHEQNPGACEQLAGRVYAGAKVVRENARKARRL